MSGAFKLCLLAALAMLTVACAEGQKNSPTEDQRFQEVVQVLDGEMDADLTFPLDDDQLAEMRQNLTSSMERLQREQFGDLDASISNVKIGGRDVVKYEAKGSRGVLIVSFHGLTGGRQRVVQCISFRNRIPPDCDSKVEQAFAAVTVGSPANG